MKYIKLYREIDEPKKINENRFIIYNYENEGYYVNTAVGYGKYYLARKLSLNTALYKLRIDFIPTYTCDIYKIKGLSDEMRAYLKRKESYEKLSTDAREMVKELRIPNKVFKNGKIYKCVGNLSTISYDMEILKYMIDTINLNRGENLESWGARVNLEKFDKWFFSE